MDRRQYTTYLRRIWLFMRIVGREADVDYKLSWRTAWQVAGTVWPDQ